MLDVFYQALLSRLVPVFHEVTLTAMLQFTPEQYPIHAVVAGVAACAASALLYGVGVWLRRMPARVSTEDQQARIERLRSVATQWLPYLLILSPTPVGGILIIAAGFFAIRPALAAFAIIAAEIFWRLSPVLG